jgi:hypothetical protein
VKKQAHTSRQRRAVAAAAAAADLQLLAIQLLLMLAQPTRALHAPRARVRYPRAGCLAAAEGLGVSAHAYVEEGPFQELFL